MMKKKSFLMLIAAAALVCTVICAAGCVSSVGDDEDDADVTGTWYHGGDGLDAMFILNEDNTGIFSAFRDDAQLTTLPGPFPVISLITWDIDGDELTIVFGDNYTATAVVDEIAGTLTTQRGIVYESVDLADDIPDVEYVWYYEDDSYAEISVDLEDNTGFAYAFEFKADKDSKRVSDQFTGSFDTYTWVPDAKGDLTTYSDGTVEHNTYGKDYATLSSDRRGGIVYTGMPSLPAAYYSMLIWAEEKLA